MGEDARAVDPFPEKCMVGRLVGVVPRQLLGQEEVAPRLGDKLRQRRRIAEDVWQPELLGVVSELLHEEPLAMKELANQCLSGGQVAVGLNPIQPTRFPLAGSDLLTDSLEA